MQSAITCLETFQDNFVLMTAVNESKRPWKHLTYCNKYAVQLLFSVFIGHDFNLENFRIEKSDKISPYIPLYLVVSSHIRNVSSNDDCYFNWPANSVYGFQITVKQNKWYKNTALSFSNINA